MIRGFKIYQIGTGAVPTAVCGRRDVHMVYLLNGSRQLQCADQDGEVERTYLLFGSPHRAEAQQGVLSYQSGYACLFTEEFIQDNGGVGSGEHWAAFHGRERSVYSLGPDQAAYLTGLFQKMLVEQQSEYHFKHELLHSYLLLVLHEAMRLRKPKPKRRFRYYFQQLCATGGLGSGWVSRRNYD